MNTYKPNEFAEMIGVSVKTLQRWDREGKLRAQRTPTDRRYYTHKQYVDYMGIVQQNKGKTIIYARVSTSNQKDDLKNQVEFLKQYANVKGIIVDEVFEDVGSGLDYNRKKWNKLLEDCMLCTVKTVLIAHKDRFIRFGYSWFEQFLKSNGVDVSSEALLESLLEIAMNSDNFSEDMKKLFANQNKDETTSKES